MNARHLIVTLALLTSAAKAEGSFIPCWPGDCNVQSHREMVLAAYAEVDPELDALVVGRIKAVRHLYGNDEVGATEFRSLWLDMVVDRSLAGCLRAGDRLALSAAGYGGWHWRERPPADMAPVLAIAEANIELEREADERDDRHFLVYEVPKQLKRNRERLIALGVAKQLPFVVLMVNDNDVPSFRRATEVVLVPGQSYLIFTPISGETRSHSRRRTTSELMFDIYPASFDGPLRAIAETNFDLERELAERGTAQDAMPCTTVARKRTTSGRGVEDGIGRSRT